MSIQAADTTVRTSIVVEAPVSRAFKVFTEDFGRFKPAEHNMLGVEIAETAVSAAGRGCWPTIRPTACC